MTDAPGTESATGIAVVIPTAGRDSLGRVLAALDGGGVDEIIVVADRGGPPLVPAHVRV